MIVITIEIIVGVIIAVVIEIVIGVRGMIVIGEETVPPRVEEKTMVIGGEKRVMSMGIGERKT